MSFPKTMLDYDSFVLLPATRNALPGMRFVGQNFSKRELRLRRLPLSSAARPYVPQSVEEKTCKPEVRAVSKFLAACAPKIVDSSSCVESGPLVNKVVKTSDKRCLTIGRGSGLSTPRPSEPWVHRRPKSCASIP
eukprot:1363764-Amorphochlora_amoeboformis.AAC.1